MTNIICRIIGIKCGLMNKNRVFLRYFMTQLQKFWTSAKVFSSQIKIVQLWYPSALACSFSKMWLVTRWWEPMDSFDNLRLVASHVSYNCHAITNCSQIMVFISLLIATWQILKTFPFWLDTWLTYMSWHRFWLRNYFHKSLHSWHFNNVPISPIPNSMSSISPIHYCRTHGQISMQHKSICLPLLTPHSKKILFFALKAMK